MTGQYRKVRNYPDADAKALDELLPGWDDKTDTELTAYALCELLIIGKQLLQRNMPFDANDTTDAVDALGDSFNYKE